MIQTTVQVSGMACSMCEAHINDAIRTAFSVEKVSSSHSKGETVILSERAAGRKCTPCRHQCHRLYGGRDQRRSLREERLFSISGRKTRNSFRYRHSGYRFDISVVDGWTQLECCSF